MNNYHLFLKPLEKAIIDLSRQIGTRGVVAIITGVSVILSVLATLALVIPQFAIEYSNDLILTVSLMIAVAIPLFVAPISVGLIISLLIRLDEAYLALLKLSTTDPLTGAANRRGFFSEVAARHQNLKSSDSETVGMVDLNSFKILNDNYGHHFGDEVLQAVVKRFQSVLGDDILGRLGGDEFAFLITGSHSRTRQIEQDIRIRCSNFTLKIEDKDEPIKVSSSIGMVPWHREESIDEALARADKALYAEKQTVGSEFRSGLYSSQDQYPQDRVKRKMNRKRIRFK